MEVRTLIGALLPRDIEIEVQDLGEITMENARVLLWGLPLRQENDAERALNWMLSSLPRDARAHLGEFRIEVDGENALGLEDGVSSHALLSKLEPGDISVDAELAKIYDRLFLFEEIEEEHLFLLRGRRRRPARIRGLTSKHAKLIGREEEKKEFQELLEQIQEDQGQILGIVGEAGIGKTRLVEDLIEEAQRAKIPFLHAQYPIDTKEPYVAFRKIVRDLAQNDARTLSRWNVKELEIDFLRLLLEPDQKIDSLSNLSEVEIQSGLFRATKRLIHASSQTPRVMFIDDLHWAKEEDLKLLDHLMEDLEKTRLLLVLVHRPLDDRTWTKRLNYNVMPLKAFTNEEVESFIKENLQVDRIPRKDLEELLHLSLGNPLFLEEIVRKLRDENLVETERLPDGKKLLRFQDTLKASRLPRTIAGILDAGFDKLEASARKTLQWLTVFGPTFDVDEVEAFFKEKGLDPEEIQNVQHLGYTYEKSVFPNRIHAFTHDLVFETIRETVPSQVLKEMNTSLGGFLEITLSKHTLTDTQRLANTFLASSNEKKAFQFSLEAGKINVQRSNFVSALYYLDQAYSLSHGLRLPATSTDELHFVLIGALIDRAEYQKARDLLQKWKEEEDSSDLKALLLECRVENQESNHEKVCGLTEDLFKNRKSIRGDRHILYEIFAERILALLFSGQTTLCRNNGEALLQEIDAKLYPEIHFLILGRIAYPAYSSGDYEKGLEYLQRAEDVLNRAMNPKEKVFLLRIYAGAFWEAARFEEAFRYYSEAIHLIEDMGLMSQTTWTYLQRGQIAIDAGRFIQAFEDIRKARDILKRYPDPVLEAKLFVNELDLFSEVGDIPSMEEHIDKIQKDHLQDLDKWNSTVFETLKSYYFEANDDFDKAEFHKKTVVKRYEEMASPMSAIRGKSRLLFFQACTSILPPDRMLHEYRNLKEEIASMKITKTRLTFWNAEVAVAAFHGNIEPNLQTYDIRNLLPLWTRLDAYKAHLKFHWLRGNKEEYDRLFEEYTQLHKERKSQIPREYWSHFEKHPLYCPEAVERIVKKGEN